MEMSRLSSSFLGWQICDDWKENTSITYVKNKNPLSMYNIFLIRKVFWVTPWIIFGIQ